MRMRIGEIVLLTPTLIASVYIIYSDLAYRLVPRNAVVYGYLLQLGLYCLLGWTHWGHNTNNVSAIHIFSLILQHCTILALTVGLELAIALTLSNALGLGDITTSALLTLPVSTYGWNCWSGWWIYTAFFSIPWIITWQYRSYLKEKIQQLANVNKNNNSRYPSLCYFHTLMPKIMRYHNCNEKKCNAEGNELYHNRYIPFTPPLIIGAITAMLL